MRSPFALFHRAWAAFAAMEDLTRQVAEIQTELNDTRRWRGQVTGKIDALLRADYLSDFVDGRYPFAVSARRFKLFSQNEEDGMVLATLQAAGLVNRTFVDIGCGASGGNSGMLAKEFGWNGLFVDRTPQGIARARSKFGANAGVSFEVTAVTPDNVDDLLKRNGMAGEIDFFSLDIDSYDYWVLEAMTVARPRVMVLEYNGHFGPEASLTVARDTDFERAPKGFHGASLAALTKLAASKDYRLVACDESGTNGFYMRNDLRPDIPAVPVAEAFRPMKTRLDPAGNERRPTLDLPAVAKETGLALVDV